MYIPALDYDEDKDLLVSGSFDKSIAFIKLEERKIIKIYKDLGNPVSGIKFIK